jgi:hypothetical protein
MPLNSLQNLNTIPINVYHCWSFYEEKGHTSLNVLSKLQTPFKYIIIGVEVGETL